MNGTGKYRRTLTAITAVVIFAAVFAEGNLKQIEAWAAEQKAVALPDLGITYENDETQSPLPSGWNQTDQGWRWLNSDGTLSHGWLTDNGRTYYMDESGIMVTGWREIDGDWYYFHQDGAMNLGTLILDTGYYQFTAKGALSSSSWIPNSGGGAYEAGCYDETAQGLLDSLNEEKKDRYFEEHPDREDEDDSDMHRQKDRYAGFTVNMDLNKAAAHRLDRAIKEGYAADIIPGEGTLTDYLSAIRSSYRNRTLAELYVRGCEDQGEAFDKIIEKTERKSGSGSSRAYTLEYYRQLGMAHREVDGTHYFMIILMR